MMIKCIVLGLLFGVTDLFVRHTDLIELNHKYDNKGVHVFDQLIFWTRDPRNGKYRVNSWKLVEPTHSNHCRPIKRGALYSVFFEHKNITIEMVSPLYRESYTDFDPEAEDKKINTEWRVNR